MPKSPRMSPRGRTRFTGRFAVDTFGNREHEVKLINDFCKSCDSSIPTQDPSCFPGCKEGVSLSTIVPVGTIFSTELQEVMPKNCKRSTKES